MDILITWAVLATGALWPGKALTTHTSNPMVGVGPGLFASTSAMTCSTPT